jgi:osmotically-inducible protein OsmY
LYDLEVVMSISTDSGLGVEERVRSQLLCNPYGPLRLLSWDYRDGVLTLQGRLPSYYLKQVAQSAVARVAGVQRVINSIEVAPSTPAIASV